MSPSETSNPNVEEQAAEFHPVPRVVPTLYILCGSFSKTETDELTRSFFTRIDNDAMKLAGKILRLPDLQPRTLDSINSELEKMLAHEYWEALMLKGVVTREDLPEIDKLASINIAVVYKSNPDDANVGQDLEKVCAKVNSFLRNRARYTLALIHFGRKLLPMANVSDYWPRFKVSDESNKGIRNEEGRDTETLTTLMLAIAFSGLLRMALGQLREFSHSADTWVNIGASALLVDIFSMKEYARNLLLLDVFQSFVGKETSQPEKQLLENILSGHFAESTTNLVTAVTSDLADEIRLTQDGNDITQAELLPHAEAYKKMRATKDLNSEQEKKAFIQALVQTFTRKSQKIEATLQKRADEEASRHFEVLQAVLDGSIVDKSFLYKAKVLSGTQPPAGFPAFVVGVEQLIELMRNCEDLKLCSRPVIPSPLTTENYFQLKSAEIYDHFRSGGIGIERFFRRFASPLGTLVLLLPVIPLLYFVLPMFLHISELQSLLISSIAVVVGGAVEFAWWEIKKHNQVSNLYISADNTQSSEEKFFNSIHSQVIEFVLRIAAKWLRGYRLEVLSKMTTLQRYVLKVQKLIRENIFSNEVYFKSHAGSGFFTKEEKATIKLLNLTYCQELAESVRSTLKQDHGDYNDYRAYILQKGIIEAINTIKKPSAVIEMVEAEVNEKINAQFKSGHVQPYVLAEENEQLKEGKKWWWLEQKAIPSGRIAEGTPIEKKFTFLPIGDDAALVTAYGQNSTFWPKDAQVTQLALRNELQCIRGLVVTRK